MCQKMTKLQDFPTVLFISQLILKGAGMKSVKEPCLYPARRSDTGIQEVRQIEMTQVNGKVQKESVAR